MAFFLHGWSGRCEICDDGEWREAGAEELAAKEADAASEIAAIGDIVRKAGEWAERVGGRVLALRKVSRVPIYSDEDHRRFGAAVKAFGKPVGGYVREEFVVRIVFCPLPLPRGWSEFGKYNNGAETGDGNEKQI